MLEPLAQPLPNQELKMPRIEERLVSLTRISSFSLFYPQLLIATCDRPKLSIIQVFNFIGF
jgi:hypothetical protein